MAMSMAQITRPKVVGDLICQKDSYLRVLETTVTSCEKSEIANGTKSGKFKSQAAGGEKWFIECEDSVLFPEGGGQPPDRGHVVILDGNKKDAIPIDNVQRQGLRCILHSPEPLEPGTRIRQEVDDTRRWHNMQQHSGQHLLSAIMDKRENLETLGWSSGIDGEMGYVDIPRRPSDEELQEIQDECNAVIRQNLGVSVETPGNTTADTLPEDYDQQNGVVRFVCIGDIDRNPCCGTHVKQTSHIGLVLLGSTKTVSRKCRLSFIAGNSAIKLATSSFAAVRNIASTISAKPEPEDVTSAVHRLSEVSLELRRNENKLVLELAKAESDRVKVILESGKSAFVHHPVHGMDFLNAVAFECKDSVKEGQVLLLASGEKPNGGPVIIAGNADAVTTYSAKVKEQITDLKGGGKGPRWQGKVGQWQKGDIEKLAALIASEIPIRIQQR